MPIHPFVGKSLRVIRYGAGRVGERMVDVEHPTFRTTMRMPELWTEPRASCGAGARASASHLLLLVEALRVLLGEKADFLTATAAEDNDGDT